MALLLTRREVLKAASVVAAAMSLPLVRTEQAWARARGRYFTARERITLGALCDRVFPADHDPGATALGVVKYVEGLLTALGVRHPPIFTGGPFSGRTPFADAARGVPGRKHPRNAFKRFPALTPRQELAWRLELYGTAEVPELAAFEAQFGPPKVGLRDIYRAGLQKVDDVAQATAGAPYAKLSTTDQDTVFGLLDAGAFAPDPRRNGATFIDIVIRHTLEGCFAAPEYGGNFRTRGWTMLGLEGDSQPLGYSIFDTTTGAYVERADHPMSTPNPDELGPGGTIVPRPLTADGLAVQTSIATLASIIPVDTV
ncbi:MAG TPA: gluconate 2-dehydrogenase subunit 3 family protein [Candidatus Binatia bacterium]|nr:gluconate 2-dehydrogenase subunit 3 family protein [Candidatus Binatia bacterium]